MSDTNDNYEKEIDQWSREYIRENPQVEYTMIRKAFEKGSEKFRDTIHARVVKGKDKEIADYKIAVNSYKLMAESAFESAKDELISAAKEIAKWKQEAEVGHTQFMKQQAEIERLKGLMQEFCSRVERGEIRSTKTYAKFKEVLKK